ncbi:prolyl-tRNA synthetase associated domain-containing protein [Epibacterium ulvae]|uniref:prolyl-tRNA synthetase associated domain-containing protein n=1 Tax=Epibacterium ulvae TaxID=1156985 RepID=UPI001BFC8DE8|nr:prolyl-tRNA synthetase associated domain-containing protein [Epibacterium ulvae]MBT8153342.1 prolyl-tRNA synthetase associated domain-containing protein [Epibacterium ulvae]
MDASSLYQDSLPITSDAFLAQLDAWDIPYALHTHVPLRTVEDAKSIEAALTVAGEKAFRIKNLYLRDRKKRNHLVTLEQDRDIDLKALAVQLGLSNLSFGSPERLMQHLGIRPGAVSPLAMVNGVQHEVTFYMDRAAQEVDVIYMHPLVNDRTVAMARADLMRWFDQIGCLVIWI